MLGLDSWRFAGYVCLCVCVCAWAVTEIMEGRVCGGCEFQFVMKPPQNGALGFVVATIKQSSWTIQLIYAGNLMELCCFWVILSNRLDKHHLLHDKLGNKQSQHRFRISCWSPHLDPLCQLSHDMSQPDTFGNMHTSSELNSRAHHDVIYYRHYRSMRS